MITNYSTVPLIRPLQECVNQNRNLTPESDVCYAEGASLMGGACGEWLTFQVHLRNQCWPGTLRLHLESCEDQYFRATVHVGNFGDERDTLRATPSCVNDRLANNLHAESVHNNFHWDVCVADEYTYNVRYRVLLKGRFFLYVRLDGNDIAGSPFSIFISDGRVSSLSTRVVNATKLRCRAMPLIKTMVDVMNDARWDFECRNVVADQYQSRRLLTLENLRKYSLVNELVLNLCDRVGNIVKHHKPYVKAWSTNLGKVIDVSYQGDGIVLVRYVVIVSRPDLDKVKDYYSSRDETTLPAFLHNLTTPCTLHVQIDGQRVYGSPFTPEISNIAEIEDYYTCFPDTMDSLSLNIEELLSRNDIDGCSQLLSRFFVQNAHMSEDERQRVTDLVSKKFDNKSKLMKLQNYLMESEMYKIGHLKEHGLGELHQYVDDQYQIMLKAKTSSIIECIKELNSYNTPVDGKTKGFNNLADVISNYARISDELRKLHRYDLANKFDSITEGLCEEIELNRWEKVLADRKQKMLKIKDQVDESARKLGDFKAKVLAKYENLEFREVEEEPVHKKVQTVQEETVTDRLLPLVQNRCSPDSYKTDVDRVVETFWRRCSNYDIHSTITRVLKSSIRLKNAINEIFFYYSREYETADNMLQYAIPRLSIDQFHIDLGVSRSLLNNRRKVDEMFEKFSVVQHGELALPENMWCVYLRELAYLNLLYKIAESGDSLMLRDNLHPSRLSAFYHLCEFHLLRLYERLFTSRPDFQRHLKFYNTNKSLRSNSNFRYEKESSMVHYFPSKTDLDSYITTEVPNIVGNGLNEEILHLVFKHYSRLSMYGRARVDPKSYQCDEDSWLSTAMFVIFSRDFGVVPGYMDGASVQKIANDTISANIEQGTYQSATFRRRLFYKDFVDALVNIISNSIYKICLNRDEMYTKSLKDNKILNITKKNKFHETRACIQSQESVLEDVNELIQILGFNNPAHVDMTIEAIYGQDSLEYLH